MKILMTGASSFSGFWFAKELAKAGHTVVCLFPRKLEAYDGVRGERVHRLLSLISPVFETSFGDELFLKTVSLSDWDLFCHHGAFVEGYKDPSFDFSYALKKNTNNIENSLLKLKEKGCNTVILTGSVFEQREGAGTDLSFPVSSYGLSKGLTSDVFSYFSHRLQMKLGKFVIPNPFGPYEEERFTSYLVKQWFKEKIPEVSFPAYVRDNIPVSLLAKAYVYFAKSLTGPFGKEKINPSGYVESQGAFVKRFSNEMSSRLNLPCAYLLKEQTEFKEPYLRVNTTYLDRQALGWEESLAWDELASYYLSTFKPLMAAQG